MEYGRWATNSDCRNQIRHPKPNGASERLYCSLTIKASLSLFLYTKTLRLEIKWNNKYKIVNGKWHNQCMKCLENSNRPKSEWDEKR